MKSELLQVHPHNPQSTMSDHPSTEPLPSPAPPLSPDRKDEDKSQQGITTIETAPTPGQEHASCDTNHNAATPPSLDYDMRKHSKGLIIVMTGIIFFNACVPVLVFYLVGHYTDLTRQTIYGIVTSVFVSALIQWPLRTWQLLRRGGQTSPQPGDQSGAWAVQKPDAKWWQRFDVFHWEFLFGIGYATIFFVIASAIDEPTGYFPFLALTPSLIVAEVGLQLVLTSFFALFDLRLPFRFGSVPKGDPWRPATYYIWEDLTAVDGGGGAAFRARLDARYRASPLFRSTLRDLGFLMGFGGMALLGIIAGLVFSGASEDIIYGLTFAIAVAWAGVGYAVGITHWKWASKRELQWWRDHGGGGGVESPQFIKGPQ